MMRSLNSYCGAFSAFSVVLTSALDGIVVPQQIAANTDFQVTFQNANEDQFRVYLAAALAGTNGPACYLLNSTNLTSPVTLNIPSSVGVSADYYNIAISDLSTHQGATYSNRFNLTNATGHYSDYENHLGGAAFWDADHLPCAAYACARQCAQASYPADLTQTSAYDVMKQCIMQCPGVSASPNQTSPALASHSSGTAYMSTRTASQALVTLAPGIVVTALETFTTQGSSTIDEAILGSLTLTLGGAAATISSKTVSLAASGVKVGDTSTAAFSAVVETVTVTESGATQTTSDVAMATPSRGAANRCRVAGAVVVAFANLAWLV